MQNLADTSSLLAQHLYPLTLAAATAQAPTQAAPQLAPGTAIPPVSAPAPSKSPEEVIIIDD
jgi:hypothetical protein